MAALGLALVVLPAIPARAQSYWRCVDGAGRVHLTEDAPPPGIRCVVAAERALWETPEPADRLGTPTPGQHGFWIAAPDGAILIRMYQTEEACRAALSERMAAAAVRPPPADVAYHCLPAGERP